MHLPDTITKEGGGLGEPRLAWSMADVREEVGGNCQPFHRAKKWPRLFLTGMTRDRHSVEELFELDL